MALLATALPRILGAFFYYAPSSDTVQQLVPALGELDSLFPWPVQPDLGSEFKGLAAVDLQGLLYDFSVLFEGQGHMPAPPWGSVYLEEDNLLMGPSTRDYRAFLVQHGVSTATGQSEPDDQFGLMLMAFVLLVENGAHDAAKVLLSDHLLPWAPRYLELVQQVEAEQCFYSCLARVASVYLETLKDGLGLAVRPAQLYF